MNIGCHISIESGIDKAPKRAADLGCEVMQIFTRSPQGGKAPELNKELIKNFKIQNSKFKILNTYIHTPYYINFASTNNRIRYGSVSVVRNELERGSLLGAKYVMTHLGSAGELSEVEAMKKTIEMLKKTLKDYKGSTKLLIENSAGAGHIIGDSLAEIKKIIDGVNSSAIAGICLDTQHSFASGYDWRDFEKTIKKVDKEIGIGNIKLIHANDSQSELGSHRDRHEHIGRGKIGIDCFQNLVAFAEKNNIDMVIETEHNSVQKDIKTINKLKQK
jgi:deoxyribonuclease IV